MATPWIADVVNAAATGSILIARSVFSAVKPLDGEPKSVMHLTVINTFAELDALREDWLRLHAADADATVFMSWPWLRAWAEVSPYPWAVLVARENNEAGRVTGLFPISPRGSLAALRFDQMREIHAMGDEAADYRGFICDPECEDEVIDAFADHFIAQRAWDRLVLKDFLDPRMQRFIARISRRSHANDPGFVLRESIGNECPLLTLPESWDAYLKTCLTPASRKSLKKRLRIAEEAGARMSVISSLDDDRAAWHLDELLRLAAARGKSSPEHLDRCRTLFESCLRGESYQTVAEISVLMLGDGGAAIAAQGSFIDRHANSIGHYTTGFDDRFASLAPGRVLDALCIRSAIERGYASVDFLRGDEPYKHQLGARSGRHTHNAIITRSNVATRVRSTISSWRAAAGL